MKTEKRKGVIAVKTATAEEFNEQINAVLSKHKNATVHFMTGGEMLGAYVEYETVLEIPETLVEEYELKGAGKKCHECPYFVRTKDKRFKWHYCAQRQSKVTECQGACEAYYQLLDQMTIKEAV